MIEAPRAPEVPPVVFVGGTGRSGTHVVAKLLSKNWRFETIPVEVRFHTDADGFPGLLAGEVSLDHFLRRLRGFWWKGFQTRRMRGMHRFLPRERLDEAAERFASRFPKAPEDACRALLWDLLSVRLENRPARSIVEQTCDTVAQAPTLVRLFPEARFVHVVRDGRDASASRVDQTRGLVRPRTRVQGLEWWEERITRIEAGAVAIPPERLLVVSLDELLQVPSPQRALRPLFRFCGTKVLGSARRFYGRRMSDEAANVGRWRRGLSARRAARIEALYAEALERLEASGARSAPILRRTFERSRGADLPPEPYLYDPAPR